MEKYVLSFIGVTFIYSFCVISWHKLLNKKIDLKDYKFYLSIAIMAFLGSFIVLCLPQFIKMPLAVLMMLCVNYMMFCKNITKSILSVIYTEIIAVISEFIFSLIGSLMFKNVIELQNTDLGILIINISVTIIGLLILKISFIYKLFNYLLKTFNNMKKSNLIIYFVLTLLLISVFLITSYMKLPFLVLIACNTLLTLLYLIMLFRLANAKENYRSINNKYETSLTSLREYEEIMDKYRVSNHENKNQLLAIRNMIDKKDKKTLNYIDKLVENKIKDNETIFYKTSKIPEGGLRAIIYSKLCKMKDEKITYDLEIVNDVMRQLHDVL